MKTLFTLASLFILIIAPFYGQIELDISKLTDPTSMEYQVFWDLRFPRVVVAFFEGGLLGLSGLLFQSLFKNPMGTPYTLGVASGSTLGAAFAIVFGLGTFTSVFGFVGAIITVVILFAITSRLKTFESNSLLLVGIALSFFYNAVLMILFYISNESQSFEIVRFTMGSLDVVGWEETSLITLCAIALLLVALRYQHELRLLLTSNDNAFLKGIAVKRVNIILLFSVSVAVGVCVSITGPIGFVGLIIPHVVKMLYKRSADRLLLPTFIYAGVFLVVSDFISRNLGGTSDIPIGIITAFVGGPFFIYLIMQRGR
ncbi:MAG: iron ABC transporter permease [Campylobacterota bacterium]|nr:iron ABC transporter permease [Campylobacterota bacterium]